MVQQVHYLDFFMESIEIAEMKIVTEERVAYAERELCKAEA